MTEVGWLAATDPMPLLEFLRGKASNRKLRLFACACCRRMWSSLTNSLWPLSRNKRCRKCVEVAELFADGLATSEELASAQDAANEYTPADCCYITNVAELAKETACQSAEADAFQGAIFAAGYFDHADEFEGAVRSSLLHCIFGNPFRPVTLDPTWLTLTVTSLAQAIYDQHCFDNLPILADALEEAGCTSAELLDHCRGRGPHVRGCWVVDLLLAKQ